MRRTNAQKAETHQHIVEAAGRLFRQNGIDAVGVDAIMHATGLTHGGFYGHFPSKEALVAEVAAASLARSAARWAQISDENPDATGLRRIVAPYLDPAHVAEVERGCVLTTLGPEMARRPEARPGLAAAVRTMAAALERCLAQGDEGRALDTQALATLSTMVGAIVLARLADTPAETAAILAAAKAAVLGTAADPSSRLPSQPPPAASAGPLSAVP